MKKILVVDDDKDILLVLKHFLKLKGYEVRVTLTCNEGLFIFYSFEPDLVLLDVNVGSEDGRVMCRKIKSSADRAHIPIILISANPENLKFYEVHGATAAIEKPFAFPELHSLIESHT